jgi:hypothetical protein
MAAKETAGIMFDMISLGTKETAGIMVDILRQQGDS